MALQRAIHARSFTTQYACYDDVRGDPKIRMASEPPPDTKAPISLAYRVDIEADIERIKSLPYGAEKESEKMRFLKSLTRVSGEEGERARKLCKSELKISNEAFDKTAYKSYRASELPDEPLSDILTTLKFYKAPPEECAEKIFNRTQSNGVQFFKVAQHNSYALFEKRLELITIDNHIFREFFYRATGSSLINCDERSQFLRY